jgi:hypothetical protein
MRFINIWIGIETERNSRSCLLGVSIAQIDLSPRLAVRDFWVCLPGVIDWRESAWKWTVDNSIIRTSASKFIFIHVEVQSYGGFNQNRSQWLIQWMLFSVWDHLWIWLQDHSNRIAVAAILEGCIACWELLVEVSFERASELTLINRETLIGCRSLRSLGVPGQFEVMECGIRYSAFANSAFHHARNNSMSPRANVGPSAFRSIWKLFVDALGNRRVKFVFFSSVENHDWWEMNWGSVRHPVSYWRTDKDADRESDAFAHLSEELWRRFRCQFECFWLIHANCLNSL